MGVVAILLFLFSPACTSTSPDRRCTAMDVSSPAHDRGGVTKQIHVGSVAVGGDAPITVQSMTITKTADVEGTLQQIYALAAAGCDIVRCTCNEAEAAEGLAQIVPRSPVPIIADIHHQYRMALAALEAGVQVCASTPATSAGPSTSRPSPARRGPRRADPHRRQRRLARPRALREVRRGVTPEAMVESAMREIAYFDEVGFDDVKISVKASSVPLMVEAYRLLSRGHRPPAAPRGHRGRTAAGRAAQGDRRHRHAAARGHRRHDPLLAHRRSGRGGARRPAAARGARAARAQERRSDRLPVVRAGRDRRDRRRQPGDGGVRRAARSRCRWR